MNFRIADTFTDSFAVLQYGTQPMLTAGPGVYPIVIAAMDALAQMDT